MPRPARAKNTQQLRVLPGSVRFSGLGSASTTLPPPRTHASASWWVRIERPCSDPPSQILSTMRPPGIAVGLLRQFREGVTGAIPGRLFRCFPVRVSSYRCGGRRPAGARRAADERRRSLPPWLARPTAPLATRSPAVGRRVQRPLRPHHRARRPGSQGLARDARARRRLAGGPREGAAERRDCVGHRSRPHRRRGWSAHGARRCGGRAGP